MKNRLISVCLAVLCALACLRCGPPATGKPASIKLSGAWALYPMAVTWAEEYRMLHPEVRIDVSAGGAGTGMTDVLAGLVDLGLVSRDVYPAEVERGAVFVPVAKVAVVCIINADNPLAGQLAKTGVKRKTLQTIWLGQVKLNWGVVSPAHTADVMHVYTRSDAAGAPETFAKYLGKHQEDLKGIGVYADPGLVEAVKKDRLGIGYCNLNYAYDAQSGAMLDGLFVVPIDVNENGIVDTNEDISVKPKVMESIATGVYPSPPARDLYFVAKDVFKGPTADFTRWVLTTGQGYVGAVGYISPTSNQLADAIALMP